MAIPTVDTIMMDIPNMIKKINISIRILMEFSIIATIATMTTITLMKLHSRMKINLVA